MDQIFSRRAKCLLALLSYGLLCLQSLVWGQIHVITYAGNGQAGLLDGDTLSAQFGQPSDIDRDPAGNLIVVDMDNSIRKISPAGWVTTLAGNGIAGYFDGPGSGSRINGATNACIDSVGNVYFSDFANQRIRKIDLNGNVSTIAGNGVAGYKDTTALHATFRYPRGICMDKQGNLFIADSWNHRIRKLDPQGNVTTVAGGGSSVGVQSPGDWVDGPDTSARFWTPCGLEIDDMGNLYLADAFNHRIRKIDPQGMVSTLAGSGMGGSTNGDYLDGATLVARFDTPTGLCLGSNGELFVTDTYNHCIRLVSGGMATTFVCSNNPGYLDGSGPQALMNRPRAALIDPSGTSMYVADGNNHVLRRVLMPLPTSVELDAVDIAVVAHPNPAMDHVAFQWPASWGTAPVMLSVMDVTGATVIGNRSCAAGEPLSIAQLAPGMYFARIQTVSGASLVKFLKQ